MRIEGATAAAAGVTDAPRELPSQDMARVERDVRARRLALRTFAAGTVLLLGLIALTLTRSPPRVLGANAPPDQPYIASSSGAVGVCQSNEALPAGVSAIRITLSAFLGPSVRVVVSSGSARLSEGARGANWTGNAVTVPVRPLAHAVSDATVCVDVGPGRESVRFAGPETPRAQAAVSSAGVPLKGRVGLEYLGDGQGSWWSRIGSVATHMGIGHALQGAWVAPLVAALIAVLAALVIGSALRALSAEEDSPRGNRSTRFARGSALRRVPRVAWACAAVAFVNALAWSLIVPPFEGKDEAPHFAYVEQLVENRALPENGQSQGTYSPELTLVLEALHYGQVADSPQTPAISTPVEQRALTRAVHAGASLRGSGEAGVASSEPPLYYALQSVPYVLARGNVLVQLQLMRLLGALFGAASALLIFLFLREALPGKPWAATVGGLCVALQPQFAFISGSVNPDSMLVTVSAGAFLVLARAFRRGLTRRRAIALGALIAVGFLTKLNFIGLAVGAFAGLAALTVREARTQGRQAWTTGALAVAVALSPVVLYVLGNLASQRAAFGIVSNDGALVSSASALVHELSYAWQLYLPRLPGMPHYFTGVHTFTDVWFDRSVGLYGWMDTTFPTWVENVALVPAAAVASLCARELFVRRVALRSRLAELGVYAAIVVGVLLMIAASSYLSDVIAHAYAFAEPRYLLPLLPLLGGVVALAVRGAGRRWLPVAGAAMIVLFLGHDIFSQLQVIARYYG